MLTKRITVFSILLLLSPFIQAQTGIFHWAYKDTSMIHNCIVDLEQLKDGNLVLLSKLEDAKHDQMFPEITKMKPDGSIDMAKFIERYHLYELNGVIIQPDDTMRVFGTELSTSNGLTPYYDWMSPLGFVPLTVHTQASMPTFVGDMQMMADGKAIILKSVVQPNKNYNIVLEKIIPSTKDSIVWATKLQSTLNEQGDKMIIAKDGSVYVLGRSYTNFDLTNYVPVIYKVATNKKVVWQKELSDVKNFYGHNLLVNEDGSMVYSYSYTNDTTGIAYTMVRKLSVDGKTMSEKKIDGIRTNVMLRLNNGNILLAGCGYIDYTDFVLTKAKYVVIGNDLAVISQNQLGMKDKPDTDFPIQEMAYQPSSSEIFCAIQLTDGRIALGGRALLPIKTDPILLLKSQRRNENLLLFLNAEGTL